MTRAFALAGIALLLGGCYTGPIPLASFQPNHQSLLDEYNVIHIQYGMELRPAQAIIPGVAQFASGERVEGAVLAAAFATGAITAIAYSAFPSDMLPTAFLGRSEGMFAGAGIALASIAYSILDFAATESGYESSRLRAAELFNANESLLAKQIMVTATATATLPKSSRVRVHLTIPGGCDRESVTGSIGVLLSHIEPTNSYEFSTAHNAEGGDICEVIVTSEFPAYGLRFSKGDELFFLITFPDFAILAQSAPEISLFL